MNKKDLFKLKEHYIDVQNQIINSLKLKSTDSEPDVAGDEVDKIQGIALHDISEKLSSRELDKLTKIENALRIIEEEGSAIDECEECGEPIGIKRLMVIHGVRICIKCAEEAESASKMFA